MNTSIALQTPIELINVTPFNPLISKVQIKVCWVGENANRNKSVITKETATELANSLPGSPIVGYYNEDKEDFESHNRIIEVRNGQFKLKDTTQPYGFVDLAAKVWFQKFVDYDNVEREYLCTEGWLWTGQFPECQRILEKGNHQSMELDENILNAYWTKDANGNKQFFIINEAIISKLCILGEDVEPAFEGANITAPKLEFSLEEDFKEKMFSMMTEIKNILEKGGKIPMYTNYAVEIGDSLWSALYSHLEANYPQENCDYPCSIYRIEGIYEEEGNKFAILQNRENMSYMRLDFTISETDGIVFGAELIEVTKTYVPAEVPQFDAEAVSSYELEYAASKKEEDKEEEETCPECGKPLDECECEEEEEEKTAYNLEEIPEYVELKNNYSELEGKFNTLNTTYEALETEVNSLREFKKGIEKKEKEDMIARFYMLSDEDKKEVIENIDSYSLEDIENKLSVICVRNKVSFADPVDNNGAPTVYELTNSSSKTSDVPDWIKAIQEVAKSL